MNFGYPTGLWSARTQPLSKELQADPVRCLLRHDTCSPSWRVVLEISHLWVWRLGVCRIVVRVVPIIENIHAIHRNYEYVWIKLTAKYGLHAERTTLCAFRNFPSAANVQSTNVPFSKSVSNTEMSVLWWLFHRRQNCWSSSILGLLIICVDSRKQ